MKCDFLHIQGRSTELHYSHELEEVDGMGTITPQQESQACAIRNNRIQEEEEVIQQGKDQSDPYSF
ncbi:hypothetical protein SAMN05444162_1324 [Paenibacillaceae bacterium GAS479]|nr:hypothetical protein SAMN05444162_1324 [Paenibacillaceae bacterium GAS479]